MVYDGILEGKYVNLRSIKEEDAEFALLLRQNPELTKFIPKLTISIEQQIQWIKKQRELEGDYFFIIEDKKGEKIGVVGIYNILGNIAESGRVIIVGNAVQSIEAQLISFDFAFNILGMTVVKHYVLASNSKALRSAMMFGSIFSMPYTDENGNLIRNGKITLENFVKNKVKIKQMIYRK